MVDVQGVGSEGGGGSGVLDGTEDELRGEGSKVVVKGPFVYLSLKLSLVAVSGRGVAGEEAAESLRYCPL